MDSCDKIWDVSLSVKRESRNYGINNSSDNV
jgi:hypothetical protein